MREQMVIGEHFEPGHGPVGLASSDGLPWARLVTGVFIVAISLATSWRVVRTPVDEAPTPAGLARTTAAEPQPDQTAMAEPLDRPEPEIVAATALREALLQPVAPAQMARMPARNPPGSHERHQLERTNAVVKVQSDLLAHRRAGMNPRSIAHGRITHVRFIRTRSEVRNEYIAAREQVAALTSEDSGSAYLARLAARQSAVRTNLAGHAQSRSQVRRRASAR